jgi:hypothetical protein
MKMIGIPENDAGAEGAEFIGRNSLDGRLGSNRHKDGCLDISAAGVKDPGPGVAGEIGLKKGEGRQGTHGDDRVPEVTKCMKKIMVRKPER